MGPPLPERVDDGNLDSAVAPCNRSANGEWPAVGHHAASVPRPATTLRRVRRS